MVMIHNVYTTEMCTNRNVQYAQTVYRLESRMHIILSVKAYAVTALVVTDRHTDEIAILPI